MAHGLFPKTGSAFSGSAYRALTLIRPFSDGDGQI
jgi:hypothetical protein